MAHDLLIQNGDASMFYVGEPPWHRLGTKLAQPATAAEAIKAARLDWDVQKVPLFAIGGNRAHAVKGKYAVVPSVRLGDSDCPTFGIVGDQYTPLQNREAFSFFDPIVGDEAAVYHTAGALGDGERVWILAKLPGGIRVAGDDVAHKFLLLSNSHDGEGSVQVKFTPIRVVCQNTLTQALSKGRTLRVAHRRDIKERLDHARQLLGIIDSRFEELEKAFKRMATVGLNQGSLRSYLEAVFPDPKDPASRRAWARVGANRRWADYFFDQGEGNQEPGVKGTLWAAYNGVTELVDHRRPPFAAPATQDEALLRSAWFGDGYLTKARAFDAAMDHVAGV